MKILYLFLLLILALPVNSAREQENSCCVVYLVQLGWHTSLVFKVDDITPEDWPEIAQWNHYNYVHIGWGDEAFYQSSDDLALLAIRAALLPTQSVIRVAGFFSSPSAYFGEKRSQIALRLSKAQYTALIREISSCFMRDQQGNLLSSYDYGHPEQFFLSCETYHFFRTCNTWMAKRLYRAGIPVRRRLILTSGQLVREVSLAKDLMEGKLIP
jgi:uncharacterized protein (TIGR02117 family)